MKRSITALAMIQAFHPNRARSLLDGAELLFDQQAMQAAGARIAGVLNRRFNQPDNG